MPRQKPTLESLKATHDAAPNPSAAKVVRQRARELAASAGKPVPAWAESRHEPKVTPFRPHARELPSATVAISNVIPPALVAWRRARPGACVRIGQAGVTLDVPFQKPLTFPSVAAAIAAVA